MCYFLYGAVNKEINQEQYEKIAADAAFSFRPGTKHDVKMSALHTSDEYRVTNWCCDCDFPLGTNAPAAAELREIDRIFRELRQADGTKCVYLSKTWTDTRNKKEETVHIDDIDLPAYLAEASVNCLYTIYLYKRY